MSTTHVTRVERARTRRVRIGDALLAAAVVGSVAAALLLRSEAPAPSVAVAGPEIAAEVQQEIVLPPMSGWSFMVASR